MSRLPPDPDAVAFARERFAAGVSTERISAEMAGMGHPVTGRTIQRWVTADEPAPPARRAKAPARRPGEAMAGRLPPGPPDSDPEVDAIPDTLATLRRTLHRTLAEVEAQRVINPKLAQQLGRDAAQLAGIVARLERNQVDDGESFTFTRKEIDQAIPALLEKMAGWIERCDAAGGLVCAVCSRKLSVELGRPVAQSAE